MNIAVAQINSRIGDISYNSDLIIKNINSAIDADADLVIFPEFALSGSPLMGVISSADFIDKCYAALEDIALASKDINVLIGMPTESGDDFFSSIAYINKGNITSFFSKAMIDSPLEKCYIKGIDSVDYNDESEDEDSEIPMNIVTIEGKRFLVVIGEDLDYIDEIDKSLKVSAIISICNPIYVRDAIVEEYEVLSEAAKSFKLPIIRCSQVGGNAASFVNFGGSSIVNKNGEILSAAKCFKSSLMQFDFDNIGKLKGNNDDLLRRKRINDNYSALKLALTDFFEKQNLKKAVVGLSGGIDSAVVTALAIKALGAENVTAILMPSKFSSQGSVDDSVAMAEMCGIKYHILPIGEAYESMISTLNPVFGDLPFSVAEENIQARLRGTLLMAYSNKFGDIVLNTSNKSECAVGYGTLYGDTNGSLSLLGDLYKDEVYELAFYINNIDKELIPAAIIDKEPSAELRPEQKDSDSLPPYEQLDEILRFLIDERMSILECVAEDFNVDVVTKVAKLIAAAEHKRHQLPPTVKMSSSTLSMDRVMPLAAKLI